MAVRHDFGPEGVAYVRSYLEANGAFGKLLGPLLLSEPQIDRGVVWATLPAELSRRRSSPVTNFEEGGIYTDRAEASSVRSVNEAWLRDTLQRQPDSWMVCVEDAFASPSGPSQAQSTEPVFYCKDSVYFYWTAASPERPTISVFDGATWSPSVGIITTIADSFASKDTLTEPTVADFAARASAIVVGAWDDEGLIFWEPQAPPVPERAREDSNL